MLVAATVGGYCGAQIGRRASARVIRVGTVVVATGITIMFFTRTYFHVQVWR
jgi:hypothetical protein